MALILHLETATTACSVALSHDSKVLAIVEMNAGYSHAENLISFCDEVLHKAKYAYSDLNAVAVSKGPGSYTGLRIGVSAAKGFCYALDIPLISVPTLEHMALEVAGKHEAKDALFCPMIDARRMEVYCAIYDASGKEQRATAAEIITDNSFDEILSNHKIIFFGDGSEKCKVHLAQHSHAVFLSNVFPSASGMVSIAEKKYQTKEFENIAYFEPYYLKDFLIAGK